jgi:hypothetical protein
MEFKMSFESKVLNYVFGGKGEKDKLTIKSTLTAKYLGRRELTQDELKKSSEYLQVEYDGITYLWWLVV